MNSTIRILKKRKDYGIFQEYDEVGWTNKISTYEKNKEENAENECFLFAQMDLILNLSLLQSIPSANSI